MRKNDFFDILFKAILLFIMILAISLGVKDYFTMEIDFFHLVMYDSALVLVITLLYIFPQIFGWGIIISVIAVVYIKYYHAKIYDMLLQDFLLFMQWMTAYIAGYTIYLEEYAAPLLLTLLIISAGIMTILIYSRINKLVITAIGIIVFSFFWFTYVEKAHLYLMIFIFASLILHSYSLWQIKKKEWEIKGIPISLSFYKNWAFSALLLLGFSIMLMLMLPLNIRPLRVMALNDFMTQHFPFIEQWKNSSEESYGYSFRFSLTNAVYKGKRLGGPVRFSGSTMMFVTGNLRGNLYLRGSVYDKYSGFNWSKSRKASELYDNRKTVDLPAKPKYQDLKVEIKPEQLISSTFFSALYPVLIEYDEDKIFINNDFELYGTRLINRSKSYSIRSNIPVLSEDMLKSAMLNADENIDKQFLKLPDSVPDRVKKLTQELTMDKSNPYDKAKAIEDYLRKNYTYTLEPEKVPEGKDFTDYFLFEQKEGYCTYYATSMAVMLRLAGIPSRYVEGFMLKHQGQGIKTYNLTDKDAHAWVEAYFGEYGWISFEATPAYEDIKPWQFSEHDNIDETPQSSGEGLPSFSQGNADRSNIEKEPLEEDIFIGERKNQKKYDGIIMKLLAFIVAALVLSRIFYGICKINRIKILTLKNSKKFADVYEKQLTWLLSRAGMKKRESQTVREFMGGIFQPFDMDINSCEHIISIIEGIIYGEKSIKAEEAKELKIFAKKLRQNIKTKLGIIKYTWNIYLGKP